VTFSDLDLSMQVVNFFFLFFFGDVTLFIIERCSVTAGLCRLAIDCHAKRENLQSAFS
jgi:hypothetical protein